MARKWQFDPEKFYDRYKEIFLLILGFFLTGIVGTHITATYQAAQQRAATRAETMRVERTEAMKTAEEISELIGKHHFNALQLRGAIEAQITDPSPENLAYMNEQSTLYRAGVREWNTEWNKNRTRLRMMFGTDFEGRFYTHSDIDQTRYDQSLTGLFNAMHNELVAAKAVALSKEKDKSYDFTTFDEKYHAIGYLSYEFYNDLIARIQAGKIGSFNKAPVEQLAPTYVSPQK